MMNFSSSMDTNRCGLSILTGLLKLERQTRATRPRVVEKKSNFLPLSIIENKRERKRPQEENKLITVKKKISPLMSFTTLYCIHNLCNDMTESMKSANFILLRLHSYIKVTPLTYNGCIFVNLESFFLSTRIYQNRCLFTTAISHTYSCLKHTLSNK